MSLARLLSVGRSLKGCEPDRARYQVREDFLPKFNVAGASGKKSQVAGPEAAAEWRPGSATSPGPESGCCPTVEEAVAARPVRPLSPAATFSDRFVQWLTHLFGSPGGNKRLAGGRGQPARDAVQSELCFEDLKVARNDFRNEEACTSGRPPVRPGPQPTNGVPRGSGAEGRRAWGRLLAHVLDSR